MINRMPTPALLQTGESRLAAGSATGNPIASHTPPVRSLPELEHQALIKRESPAGSQQVKIGSGHVILRGPGDVDHCAKRGDR
jgi:hypothetical protein